MEIHIGNRVAEIELVSKEDNKVVLTIDGKTFEADVFPSMVSTKIGRAHV